MGYFINLLVVLWIRLFSGRSEVVLVDCATPSRLPDLKSSDFFSYFQVSISDYVIMWFNGLFVIGLPSYTVG